MNDRWPQPPLSARKLIWMFEGPGITEYVSDVSPIPDVTRESIARAKADRDRERADITAKTGLVITEDGRFVKRAIDPWLTGEALGHAMLEAVYRPRRF